MEYQYYVDQIQNQTENASATPLEDKAVDSANASEQQVEAKSESPWTVLVVPNKAEEPSEKTPEQSVPAVSVNAPVPEDIDQGTEDNEYRSLLEKASSSEANVPARTLPLADAFRRRQHYVESLLTCCAATRQCSMDGDPLTYLRFRAKNESIACELTNARGRLTGRVGRLRMPLARRFDLIGHRLSNLYILVLAAAVVVAYFWVIAFVSLKYGR